jgi:hypothetical protein
MAVPVQAQRPQLADYVSDTQALSQSDRTIFRLWHIADMTTVLGDVREKNRETIVRMNTPLNDLIAKEVGSNDGRFLKEFTSPK